MESSEDDAGAATNASRRASARERDVGGGEDGGASDEMPQETTEAGMASESASMSEEAYDADSVPSPSSHDVNTSTEAILDMIDEIVDGPDASRRRSHTSPDTGTVGACTEPSVPTVAPCDPGSPQTSTSPTLILAVNTESDTVSQLQESCSDVPLVSEPQCVAQTSDTYVLEVSPSVNNTLEECPSAPPTGVSPLAEVLQDKPEYSMQEHTVRSSTLVEVDTRPATQDNIQTEQPPCQEVLVLEESAANVPIEPISEACPEVSIVDGSIDSVPKLSESEEPARFPSEVQSENVNPIQNSPEVPIILPQSLSEPVESPQASSSVASNEAAESTSGEPALLLHPDESSNLSPSLPSSSIAEIVPIITDSSENQVCEQTIKCVTSSENRDNVTVESAESTCSESSSSGVGEERGADVGVGSAGGEPVTRSPLRRRLVRPAPSDRRRPDSTVSSSVDSQNDCVDTTEQTTSESVTKDVSSSSDAVTSVYCNIKPEEIRVSEISVCKAETSMSPPKKIKLVRQKITPLVAQRDVTCELLVSRESEQCQSTSSEWAPSAPQAIASSSSSFSRTTKPEESIECLNNDCATRALVVPLAEKSNENSNKKFQDCESKLQDNDSIHQSPALTERQETSKEDQEARVPPIKLNLSTSTETTSTDTKLENQELDRVAASIEVQDTPGCAKQVPKLTIKLSSKQSEETKSPIPKLTIRPIKPPLINPRNDNSKKDVSDQVPSIMKLNIKPIIKPSGNVNDIHRKSSSSEISESESSENDESNSMSDPTSNSDQASEVIPKVTIKVGKPGTESEGKFYTEQNAPKLLIKGLQSNEIEEHVSTSKLKLVVSQPQQEQEKHEKIPKLTIKTVSKSEGQPLSPKLTIKPIKPPETHTHSSVESAENPPIPKMRITSESISSNVDVKENAHVPKITIKNVVKPDSETVSRTPKKSAVLCDSPEHIPVVTKLNIKPILKPIEYENIDDLDEKVPVISKLNIKPIVKPADSGETSERSDSQIPVVSKLNIKPIIKPADANETSESTDDIPVVSKLKFKPILKPTESGSSSEGIEDKVPVVSKLNIKPILKPKDSEIESSLEDIPKVTKLNIKPLKNPEEKSSEEKDCDVKDADTEENSIPVVTKINIKPIVKPVDEDTSKDSENQSSETGNSSDDNTDHIPVVTKINIKPIVKPNDQEQESTLPNVLKEENIPVITKLNIKPLVKPDECKSPSSPKRDMKITKLNIKPVIKPEELDEQKMKNESEDVSAKNPPLLMKINIKNVSDVNTSESAFSDNKKINSVDDHSKHMVNNLEENIPKVTKINIKPIVDPDCEKTKEISANMAAVLMNCKQSSSQSHQNQTQIQNCVPDLQEDAKFNKHVEKPKFVKEKIIEPIELQKQVHANTFNATKTGEVSKPNDLNLEESTTKAIFNQASNKPKSSLQNCTLLKKLLETKKDGLDKRLDETKISVNHTQPPISEIPATAEHLSFTQHSTATVNSEMHKSDFSQNKIDTSVSKVEAIKNSSTENICKESNESLTKPLEISISDKFTNQSSGQDSPRIILKINKTDHGPSAKLITEDRPSTPQLNVTENTQEIVNEKQSQKRVIISRKKSLPDTPNVNMGKRLRSSRIVEEKSPIVKKNVGKRPPSTEISPVQNKEPELSILESKRLKLGQLLSNKSLTITPVPAKSASVSPSKPSIDSKQTKGKTVNHSLLNNENCSKNGNSKLHNILSNLQAKQAQALAFTEIKRTEKISITPELESNTSTGSSDVIEVIVPVENSHPDVMIINDNSESRELVGPTDEVSQDPLEVKPAKPSEEASPSPVPLTPQPKKRGRPRKLPLSEPAKPVVLPVPALEERPQRSLRLSRERPTPTILVKPRGRGRGRGARRVEPEPREEPVVDTANKFFIDEKPAEDVDPTSSRIKLPRMTEALDKLPACTTPLSSRRRSSSTSTSTAEMKLFDSEPKVVLNIMPKLEEALASPTGRGRGGRGRRGGRGQTPARTPRSGRGRGRGGGRGAQYMKETMGIYGRVCGPATTTVQLFEEETCMMDDNATPAKSMNYDEDSQSSVLSSTNDSSRMKKSKFADLFDSNKIWTAADVKEYKWPPPETPDVEHQVMMIQEQVAMFLGVKSFKRRYPELKRRAVTAEERDYVLHKGLVTEALCDLGITAVDASEVLDIMLSDYPHKYEEYRQHQRERQLAEATAAAEDPPLEKPEQKPEKVEVKVEPKPIEPKPEPPKVDLEKTRLEAMAAAIASASEWNLRVNACRARACVDLQTNTVHRRRPPQRPAPPPAPSPATLYPHALLPGQYQHHYTTYSSEQLRFFPLNTVVTAPPPPPPAPPSESESEPDCSSSGSDRDSDSNRPSQAKRKKLTKTKRSSQAEISVKEEPKEDVDLCRVCKLRLEANRKYTHERFLVCATCNAKLHPGCVDLSADTIRAAREYAWQCAECKACCSCHNKQDDSKMLFCDLCDRGFHIYCVGLPAVPSGRWHCVECAICKSCGAREPGGPPGAGAAGAGGEEEIWHHQTKRGPGGHKVYSHSLCTPCARAYRIGRYCPLCDRSFIGPKGTMQLVICKLCDRQHHQDCVKQTVSALNVLDYTCAECRRGGITSRSAAARLAPRTIATLFMAKRRFNKYAHRQYLQSRAAELRKDDDESREPETVDPPVVAPPEDSDASDAERLPSDPLEGAGESLEAAADPLHEEEREAGAETERDETAAAVAALQMDFGD